LALTATRDRPLVVEPGGFFHLVRRDPLVAQLDAVRTQEAEDCALAQVLGEHELG